MPKNKEHSQSERKKYLRTLMMDMGLKSLNELSKEERAKWLRAAEPQKLVKKRLKEMGYSMDSDNNKKSLGRPSRISDFHKVAANSESAE